MGMPDRRATKPHFPAVDTDTRYESEAQRRGIYGPSTSPNSDVMHIGNHKLERRPGDEAAERPIKRRRNEEEEGDSSRSRKRPETLKVIVSNRGGPEHQQASNQAVDPIRGARQASQSRRSTPNDSTPSRDPRLRRGEDVASPMDLKSMQVSPIPSGDFPVERRMLGEQTQQSSQHGLVGIGFVTPRFSVQQGERQSHSPGPREAYVPPASHGEKEDASEAPGGRKDDHRSLAHIQNDGQPSRAENQAVNHPSHPLTFNETHPVPATAPTTTENPASADDIRGIIENRMKAFEEEELIKQAKHEADMMQRKARQKLELEHELNEKIKQKKDEAEAARRADFQKHEDQYEKNLAEMRRW